MYQSVDDVTTVYCTLEHFGTSYRCVSVVVSGWYSMRDCTFPRQCDQKISCNGSRPARSTAMETWMETDLEAHGVARERAISLPEPLGVVPGGSNHELSITSEQVLFELSPAAEVHSTCVQKGARLKLTPSLRTMRAAASFSRNGCVGRPRWPSPFTTSRNRRDPSQASWPPAGRTATSQR